VFFSSKFREKSEKVYKKYCEKIPIAEKPFPSTKHALKDMPK